MVLSNSDAGKPYFCTAAYALIFHVLATILEPFLTLRPRRFHSRVRVPIPKNLGKNGQTESFYRKYSEIRCGLGVFKSALGGNRKRMQDLRLNDPPSP